MNWVKVIFPERRRVYIDDYELGYTNALQYVGEDGTYSFDLEEPLDYTPRRQRVRVQGSSKGRPMILEFEQVEEA